METIDVELHTPVARAGMECDLLSSLLILWHKKHGFLMQVRTSDAPIMPSCIGFFGGGIHEGETPYNAAIREMGEELGISVDVEFYTRRIAAVEPDHRELAYFFSAQVYNDDYAVYEGAGSIWVDVNNPPAGLYARDLKTLLQFECGK